MLYMRGKVSFYKEQIGYRTGLWKDAENIIWAYPKQNNLEAEWSEGYDRSFLKAEVVLDSLQGSDNRQIRVVEKYSRNGKLPQLEDEIIKW